MTNDRMIKVAGVIISGRRSVSEIWNEAGRLMF